MLRHADTPDAGTSELVQYLESGRAALLKALEGLPADLAVASPGPERWSIGQCVEHLALAEDLMYARLEAGSVSPTPVVNAQRERLILAYGPDRRKPIKAPAAVHPTGRFESIAAATDAFLASRARTLRFVESFEGDLRALMTTHPLLGELNGYEMLLIMAVHPYRHINQIRETLSALQASSSPDQR